jgi:hypothetical protein
VDDFTAAGFSLDRVDDVVEPWRFELDGWVERVRALRHVDSALRPLTDDEFEAGVHAVITSSSGESAGGPIVSDATLRLVTLVNRSTP